MIGSGIASSLVHEVGHQGAALLDLVNPLRLALQSTGRANPSTREAWRLWERWISEMVADFWSVAMIGIGSTLGLMGVLSLPRAFVFRAVTDDPHPIPWIRVLLSCTIGSMLYPDPQWSRLRRIWSMFYPLRAVSAGQQRLFGMLQDTMPAVVELMAQQRPALLRGRSLMDAMPITERTPDRLRAYRDAWGRDSRAWRSAAPTLAFAVIGQARADGVMTPEREARLLGALLSHWALRTTIDTSEACAAQPRVTPIARIPAAVHSFAYDAT
jgi:hypothetical protein